MLIFNDSHKSTYLYLAELRAQVRIRVLSLFSTHVSTIMVPILITRVRT